MTNGQGNPTPQSQPDKKLYVADIRAGIVREWFLLTKKEQRLTQTSKPYLALTLADRTGEMDARWWDAELQDISATCGNIIRVEATAEEYPVGRGTYQLKVSRVWEPKPGVHFIPDISHFFKASKRDPHEMYAEMLDVIGAHTSGGITALLDTVMSDDIIAPLLMRAPAAKTYHHAYLSGLLEHILSLMRAALALREHYKFDLGIVLAACALHDIGKCWELDCARGTAYSKLGVLHGHIAIGFSLIDRLCDQLDLDKDTQAHILHIIASHHGSKENGSPVAPATREAIIFSSLDRLDATLAAVDAAEELPSDEDALFTPYIPALRSRVLRAKPSTQPVVQDGDRQGETRVHDNQRSSSA
jgi:3'-5' exoribonuclease